MVADTALSYGPKGYATILEFLMQNIPPDSFISSSILSPSDFLAFMLAPHAAFLLILDDMSSASEMDAWNVWEESKAYGIACFCTDD